VLVAQAVFILERGQTDRQTRLNALPTPAAMQPSWVIKQTDATKNNIAAGVGNDKKLALTRVQRPTPALFIVLRDLDP